MDDSPEQAVRALRGAGRLAEAARMDVARRLAAKGGAGP
jgi:hypothetical protein